MKKSEHPDLNQGHSDIYEPLQSDALPAELWSDDKNCKLLLNKFI